MATTGIALMAIVPGDALTVDHSVTIPDGQGISQASMYLKRYAWDTAALTSPPGKVITPVQQNGIGQITNTGSLVNGKNTAELVFTWTAADTALLIPGVAYVWWIEVLTVSGSPFTVETGAWQMLSSGRHG